MSRMEKREKKSFVQMIKDMKTWKKITILAVLIVIMAIVIAVVSVVADSQRIIGIVKAVVGKLNDCNAVLVRIVGNGVILRLRGCNEVVYSVLHGGHASAVHTSGYVKNEDDVRGDGAGTGYNVAGGIGLNGNIHFARIGIIDGCLLHGNTVIGVAVCGRGRNFTGCECRHGENAHEHYQH